MPAPKRSPKHMERGGSIEIYQYVTVGRASDPMDAFGVIEEIIAQGDGTAEEVTFRFTHDGVTFNITASVSP